MSTNLLNSNIKVATRRRTRFTSLMARQYYFSPDDWLRLAVEANFSARRLAGAFGISQRQLERWTHQLFGSTPHRWLREERMKLAAQALKQPVPIKTISAELGFKQPSHFSREFKRHHGVSPAAFFRSRQNVVFR